MSSPIGSSEIRVVIRPLQAPGFEPELIPAQLFKRIFDAFLAALIAAGTLGAVATPLPAAAADRFDLQLNFGCGAQTTRPVTTVGPIHILYHYGDPGHVPKIGYESFRRRDLPPDACQ